MSIKLKVFIIISIIIFTQLITPSYVFCNDDYEYVYGKTNLLILGANEKDDTPYNFIMVLTIDSINKSLALTSIQKDSRFDTWDCSLYDVYLNNNEEYLKQVIKEYYSIKVDNYVVIDKTALMKIVDTAGNIKFNNTLVSGNDVLNYLDTTINVDIKVQEKIQRDVIQELLYGFSRLPFSKYPYVIKETFNYVKVDLTPFRMLSLGFTALSLKNYKATQFHIPN
ncbi:MAG: LCP family protein [Peptostreptococcaceae bacterium]